MSQQTLYEIEGRVGGPFTLVQLQLMAASGMLRPNDRIRRKGSEELYEARSIRELFSPSPLVPTAAPRAMSSEQAEMTDTQRESFGSDSEPRDRDVRAAFDFFSTPPPPPPPAKQKDKTPAPPAKPASTAFELPRMQEAAPAVSTEVEENPFDFRIDPAPSPKRDSKPDDQEATVLMDVHDLMPKAGAAEPTPAARTRSSPTAGKKTELIVEPKPAPKREQAPALKMDDGGKAKSEAEAAPIPAQSVPSTRAEITGQAIELMADGCARPMDGKSVFRLHRTWLLFATKYSDETSRAIYLRLEQIDAGTIEHRPAPAHFKGGPYSVLTFSAGEIHASLAFHGTDKPYRAFLEKVLMQCNAVSNYQTGKQ